MCYTAILYIQHRDWGGSTINTEYIRNTDTNLDSAVEFIGNDYIVGNNYACYYDTRDHNKISFDIAYNTGYWVGVGILSFAMLILIIAMVHDVLAALLSDRMSCWFFESLYFWFWTGTVLPLCLFLPVYELAPIKPGARLANLVLLFQFLTIGPMPYVFCRWDAMVLTIYSILVWGLVGWGTPFIGWDFGRAAGLACSWAAIAAFVASTFTISWFRNRRSTVLPTMNPVAAPQLVVQLVPVVQEVVVERPVIVQQTVYVDRPVVVERYPSGVNPFLINDNSQQPPQYAEAVVSSGADGVVERSLDPVKVHIS
jgi:hypothetical protein